YGGPDAARVDPAEFAPPRGEFFVGVVDGLAVSMGGWRLIGDDEAELKRMYVIESHRRRGLARRMLHHLEASAATAGVRRMLLNTGLEQPEAIALYESEGYTPVPGFGHYADAPAAVFYGKELIGRERLAEDGAVSRG